jgi:hypothetical protein
MNLTSLVKRRNELDSDIEIAIRQLITGVQNGSTKLARTTIIASFEKTYKAATIQRVENEQEIDKIVKDMAGSYVPIHPPEWNIWDVDYVDYVEPVNTWDEFLECKPDDTVKIDLDSVHEKYDAKVAKASRNKKV